MRTSTPEAGTVFHGGVCTGGQQGGMAYQPALDGLRALAVASVIAYHFGYGWARGGYLGVDTFFVLSGFLITSLLLAEFRRESRIDLGGFWARRARRLLPALFLVLAAVAAYATWWMPAGVAGRDPGRRAGGALLLGQLAVHLRAQLVLQPVRIPVDARAHVVARDRGAVLPALATDRRGVPCARPGATRSARGARHRVCHRLGTAHGAPGKRRSEPGVLRHGHEGALPPRGCVARARPRTPAHRPHRSRGTDPPRHRRSGAPRRHRGIRHDRRRPAVHVPRRVPRVRARGRRRHRRRSATSRAGASASLTRATRVDRHDLIRPLPVALAGAARPHTESHPSRTVSRSTSFASR